ncbi:DUF6864 domain-containing function [Aeromonas jandaei]|uniref:DUF6864 domain-containing function n=1 Tax=Aeromonas veronii TaxID=654 RepID=UPI001C785BBC|nr:hypothetical protein HQ400_05055 [Aeromonas jandaei]
MNKFGIDFSVTTNNCEVIESGVVHVFSSEISFKIDNLIFRCIFENDNEIGSHYSGQVENGEFVLRLYNFNNSLGEGVSFPLQVATLRNRKLYFLFYINTFANTSDSNKKLREFKYSFLLGGENE